MADLEYGIKWRWKDGREFVAGGYGLNGARIMLAGAQGAKPANSDPLPVAVMMRRVGDWRPVEDPTPLDRPAGSASRQDGLRTR
jgi:hypothetical protein